MTLFYEELKRFKEKQATIIINDILNEIIDNMGINNDDNEINEITDLFQSKCSIEHSKSEAVDNDVKTPTLFPLNKSEIERRINEHLSFTSNGKFETQLMNLATLKEAHLYCVIYKISSQKYGPLLEKFIQTRFNYNKNKAEDCTGDCSKDGKNLEIKVSLGGAKSTKFNYVQIRLSHDCDIYILTAYHLSSKNKDEGGELYIFKVPKSDIKKLIKSYGGYAHGTRGEHGDITDDSLNDEKSMKEYALRPIINGKCWEALMRFRIPESEL